MNRCNFFNARKWHYGIIKVINYFSVQCIVPELIPTYSSNSSFNIRWSYKFDGVPATAAHPSTAVAITSFRATLFPDLSRDFGVEIAVCRWITDDCVCEHLRIKWKTMIKCFSIVFLQSHHHL